MILMVQFVAHTVKHALHLPTVGLATRTIRHPATHAVIITGGSAAARAISLLLAPPHSGVLWLYVRDRVAIRAIATGMYGTLVHTIPWWILWQTAWGGGVRTPTRVLFPSSRQLVSGLRRLCLLLLKSTCEM